NAAVFIVGRFLQGLGGGIDSVVLYVLIARQIPDGARPKMFGLFTTAWLLPSVAGPLLAGTLAHPPTRRTGASLRPGWSATPRAGRPVFALTLVGSALALAGLLRTSRTDPAPAADHAPDLPRARMAAILGRRGLLAVVAAGILLALHFGAQLPGAWALAVVLLAMAALLRAAGAILPPGTLRLRGPAQRLVPRRALLGATLAGTDVYLTLYLQTQRGFTPTSAGLVITAGAAGWAIGAWVQSRFPSTHGEHRRLILL